MTDDDTRSDGGTAESTVRFEDLDWSNADQRSPFHLVFTVVAGVSGAALVWFLLTAVYTFLLVPIGVPKVGVAEFAWNWNSRISARMLLTGMAGITTMLSLVRNPWLLGSILAIDAAVIYDFFLVSTGDPTLSLGSITYDVRGPEWLLYYAAALIVVYAVVPAYRNPRQTKYYWRRFRKNRAAVASLVFLILLFGTGLIAPAFVAPPEFDGSAQNQPPAFMSTPLSTMGGDPGKCVGETTITSQETIAGGAKTVYEGTCHGTLKHPLGTTGSGKGLLISIVYGMRTSLEIGLLPTMIIIILGMAVGASAAYSGAGSLLDEILMRYVDIQQVFPVFFLYLLIFYIFGLDLVGMILIFGLLQWGGTARLVRGAALQLREKEYIKAAQGVGAKSGYIIRRHMMPNVANIVVTSASLLIPGFILTEAGLAFLGLGDPTIPSWGQLIASGRGSLSLDSAWWIATIPGVFLFVTVLALNYIGDALNEALDPELENN
jgi:peptide/nickel transport system permease protein